MMDRRLVENFDWSIVFLFFAISCLGLLSLYSALYTQIQMNPTRNLFIKQVIWFASGCLVFLATLLVDYQKLKKLAPWMYAATLLALAVVLVVGEGIKGSRRWLNIAGFNLQPSEFMKLVLVLQLARMFSSQDVEPYPPIKQLIPAVLVSLVPAVLIVVEPDLGTTVCLLAVAFTMIFVLGIRWKYLILIAIVGVLSIYPLWHYGLKEYQKERVRTVLAPERDPMGSGYHTIQSKVAVGSGMMWGKGFLNGTQNKLRFLPEKHTDFIFSVWAEEWGFWGCTVMIALFFLFVCASLRVARVAKDRFGMLVVVGLTALIMWQALINIGMVIGLLPVVGITLPFVSYGGSSLLTLCAAVGLIENVSMRRYAFRPR